MYWNIKAYKIAEKGIFNKKGLTPIDSVYSTNLWDVLTFISIEHAEKTYESELHKQSIDEQNKKNRR